MYCEGAIRYQFNKFVDFIMSTRQILQGIAKGELHFSVDKGVFVKNVSLGKVKEPLKRIYDRITKHCCNEGGMKDYIWEEVTVRIRE